MGNINKEYTLGFMFANNGENVLLIKKNRPAWQEGLWNGIGGKVEHGETYYEAQTREFQEETGLTIYNWELFCQLDGEADGERFRLFIMHFVEPLNMLSQDARTVTDEKIKSFRTADIDDLNVVPNLRWIIPMALANYRDTFRTQYYVNEVDEMRFK